MDTSIICRIEDSFLLVYRHQSINQPQVQPSSSRQDRSVNIHTGVASSAAQCFKIRVERLSGPVLLPSLSELRTTSASCTVKVVNRFCALYAGGSIFVYSLGTSAANLYFFEKLRTKRPTFPVASCSHLPSESCNAGMLERVPLFWRRRLERVHHSFFPLGSRCNASRSLFT